MTNTAIILGQMTILIAEGKITAENEIHTYSHWKSMGYQVKRGEKAIAKFPIWKYTTKKKGESEEEAQANKHCFLKNSAWFSDSQVELIEK